MRTATFLIATGLALTGWAALAKPVAAPASPTPAEIVAARQAGMAMSAATFTTIRTANAAGTPMKDLAFAAGALAKWGASMPALFHPSTRTVTSRAKPEVWTDKPGFAARTAAFADATRALAAAAKADDKVAFAAALASTGAACKGCHDSYQVPPPAAKPG
ncbi:cytochrome c556 [Novosphingobium kunmingense]|uniref:Cytochrome c556 n=1 Tax=Novosphingobium kunmingense TaxID=1211806 RepID=A0A2N0H314_9SPHN|nr:cytochrome c [Novosphingobium kunmingense]PKB13307.1 cytochrome c556 [Novosphingobium kunmingense]